MEGLKPRDAGIGDYVARVAGSPAKPSGDYPGANEFVGLMMFMSFPTGGMQSHGRAQQAKHNDRQPEQPQGPCGSDQELTERV